MDANLLRGTLRLPIIVHISVFVFHNIVTASVRAYSTIIGNITPTLIYEMFALASTSCMAEMLILIY
jgi:hypothetical protein